VGAAVAYFYDPYQDEWDTLDLGIARNFAVATWLPDGTVLLLNGYTSEPGEGSRTVPRPVHIVDAGQRKEMDLKVVCAADDFSLMPQDSVWPLVFDEVLEEIRKHKTTLIFVNNRRLAERVAATLNERITGATEASFHLYNVPRQTKWTTGDQTAGSVPDAEKRRREGEDREADA
jgi:Lhr-like helicase